MVSKNSEVTNVKGIKDDAKIEGQRDRERIRIKLIGNRNMSTVSKRFNII